METNEKNKISKWSENIWDILREAGSAPAFLSSRTEQGWRQKVQLNISA